MSLLQERTVAADIMTAIRAYGVDVVFGIPGTHNIELFRPLRELGFNAVTNRHEQGAAFAADGWAQLSGNPGVVLTTSGPGLLNALSAAATSWAESRSMLVISPGSARGRQGLRVGALHETKDPVGASGSVLEWSRRVLSQEDAIQAVHDAFELFRTSRPAPVHIEVPLDLLEETSRLDPALLGARPHAVRSVPTAGELERAAALLEQAERPAILAGGGSLAARDALRILAERLQAPLVTTVNGKGLLDERHPLAVGSDVRLEPVQRLLSDADVLLVVGSDVGEAELWDRPLVPGGPVVRIDIDPKQLKTTLTPQVPLLGDASVVVPALLETMGGATRRTSGSWADVAALREELLQHVRSSQPALAHVVEAIAAVLPADAVLAGDSSQVTYMATSTLWVSERPNQLLYMPTYATLGYGLPAALGAKIAVPERAVVGVIGDGALMFSIQEFVTAVEQRVCLPIVCVDNGGYLEIQGNMRDAGMEPISVELQQPRWADLGRALGGYGFETEIDGLSDILAEALALDLPSIIHVRIPS